MVDFNSLINEYSSWVTSGSSKVPKNFTEDAAFAETLKKKRLEKAGISKTVKLKDSDKKPYLLNAEDKSSGRYKVQSACKRVYNDITYTDIHSGKTLKTLDCTDLIILRTIDVADGMAPEPDDLYNCPNCGAAVKLGVLEKEGCPFCGTRVDMSDLYPMVSNAFFAHDNKSLKDKDIYLDVIGGGALIFALPGILVGLGGGAAAAEDSGPLLFLPIILICTVICTALSSLFGIIVTLAMTLVICSIFGNKILRKLRFSYREKKGLKPKYREIITKYDPNFRFEMLVNTCWSLHNILVFSDDYSNLSQYIGEDKTAKFTDVIDTTFNSLTVDSVEISPDNNYIVADVRIMTTDTRLTDGDLKISAFNHYPMRIVKRIAAFSDAGFSIHKVSCESCGASFDAVHDAACPYCGTKYDISGKDWVVVSISHR